MSLVVVVACGIPSPAPQEPTVELRTSDSPAPLPTTLNDAWVGPDTLTVTHRVVFNEEVRALFRLAACAGDAPLPSGTDEAAHRTHCDWLQRRIEQYRRVYVEEAMPFIQALHPPDVSTTVVYPFGGGDLLGALTTYPDAREISTLSLERAGDPRTVYAIPDTGAALSHLRDTIGGLLTIQDSTTQNLDSAERAVLPGQLSFFLIALAVHGFEPISLSYFRVEPDGSLDYLSSAEDIPLPEGRGDQSDLAFQNLELVFRRPGESASANRVHRHFEANLDDEHFSPDVPLYRYLASFERVATMTKAASYLLWWDSFSNIRAFLLEHSAFMISDSTGLPPALAREAGFEIQTFGRFSQPFLPAGGVVARDMRELWSSQPARPLGFRYGYMDGRRQNHMMVLRWTGDSP